MDAEPMEQAPSLPGSAEKPCAPCGCSMKTALHPCFFAAWKHAVSSLDCRKLIADYKPRSAWIYASRQA